MSSRKRTLDDLEVVKTLGKGASAKVKLVKDSNGKQYAAKIMQVTTELYKERFREMARTEFSLIQQIDHPNVVKVFRISENGIYTRSNGKTKNVMYILMELCQGGEVFDFLFHTGAFPEPVARFYFKQLLEALKSIHDAGYCHRDLKPENLLFDKDFNLKVTDFGFSVYLSGRDGSGMLKTHLGTEQYMAPEIHENRQYKGDLVDVFACGVILFILKSQNPPFRFGALNDQWYNLFTNNNSGFWRQHNRIKGTGFYSEAFTQLINGMLDYREAKRMTVDQIMSSDWFNGPACTPNEILQEFMSRKSKVESAVQAEQQAQQVKAGQIAAQSRAQGRVFRGSGEGEQDVEFEEENKQEIAACEEAEPFEPSKILPDFKEGIQKLTTFVTSKNPDELSTILEMYFEEKGAKCEIDEQAYKIKATIAPTDNELKDLFGDVDVKITFYKYQKGFVVDFAKENGLAVAFHQAVEDIINAEEVKECLKGMKTFNLQEVV